MDIDNFLVLHFCIMVVFYMNFYKFEKKNYILNENEGMSHERIFTLYKNSSIYEI